MKAVLLSIVFLCAVLTGCSNQTSLTTNQSEIAHNVQSNEVMLISEGFYYTPTPKKISRNRPALYTYYAFLNDHELTGFTTEDSPEIVVTKLSMYLHDWPGAKYPASYTVVDSRIAGKREFGTFMPTVHHTLTGELKDGWLHLEVSRTDTLFKDQAPIVEGWDMMPFRLKNR